jgi:hypothetical protein
MIEPKSSVVKLAGRTPEDPQVGLADQVVAAERGMWPTPDVPNGGRGIPKDARWTGNSCYTEDGRKVQVGLANVVRMWPTPRANDWKGGLPYGTTSPRQECDFFLPDKVNLIQQTSGQLNPTFVEWMMGFSRDWTEVD